ncbi:hypothetical protein UPYG_G00264610 [Umbra pygmaea]|uniref:Uncharacterized protein n=1 Tax=Umbra pygmaea TaxID=75934 RepID=A0ABD0WTX5_UMBPY
MRKMEREVGILQKPLSLSAQCRYGFVHYEGETTVIKRKLQVLVPVAAVTVEGRVWVFCSSYTLKRERQEKQRPSQSEPGTETGELRCRGEGRHRPSIPCPRGTDHTSR